jgi:regulator of chromosome condensation
MREIVEGDGSDSDSDDDDSGLNPTEAEPREVDHNYFPEGTKFASLYAGDSTTFALTTTGKVYGWGTFRVSVLGLAMVFS